jgi:hypothetical protein
MNLAVESAPRAEVSLLRAAAALSLAAALIHASVIASHFREYWLFGLLFAITAVGQFVWAGLVWTRPPSRSLLLAGAIANLGVAVVWLSSRTVGLPIGPDPGEREAIGIHDVFATADELALAALIALALAGRGRDWVVPGAWALAAASGLSAFLGPH